MSARPSHRLLVGLLCLTVLALGVAAALPHVHRAGEGHQAPHACYLCKAHQSCVATRPTLIVQSSPWTTVGDVPHFVSCLRSTQGVTRCSARAPPSLA